MCSSADCRVRFSPLNERPNADIEVMQMQAAAQESRFHHCAKAEEDQLGISENSTSRTVLLDKGGVGCESVKEELRRVAIASIL